MQTFLPYNDYTECAKVLDMKRLGKQRVEVLQLLKWIHGLKAGVGKKGWSNHPARKMWYTDSYDFTNALVCYGVAICQEWISRGYNDTCLSKIEHYYDKSLRTDNPKFIGDELFHESHRSKLIHKKPEYYRKFWPNIPDDLECIWPSGE